MAWTADDWQSRIVFLAQRYHKRMGNHGLTMIPDSHGDCGLEAFSTDGCAYQCYVPDEHAEVPLTDRIVKKMYEDTLKLKKRSSELAEMLGDIKIRFWSLVIPPESFRDKKVVQKAGTRTALVRDWNLSFISPDFRILVTDGREFNDDVEELRRLLRPKIVIDGIDDVESLVPEWERKNPEQISTVENKLRKTNRPAEAISSVRKELIKCLIAGQNSLERIRESSPETYEIVVKTKRGKADALRMECAMTSMLPADFLMRTIEEFKGRLKQFLPELDESGAHVLANEAVGDWLIGCSLDFYKES